MFWGHYGHSKETMHVPWDPSGERCFNSACRLEDKPKFKKRGLSGTRFGPSNGPVLNRAVAQTSTKERTTKATAAAPLEGEQTN